MSTKALKKGVVKGVNRHNLEITILGPIGDKGIYREKAVYLHSLNFSEEAVKPAFEYLVDILPGVEIKFDDYAMEDGRTNADVFVGDKLINAEIASRGLGLVTRTSKPSKHYDDILEQGKKARDAGLGVHSKTFKEDRKAHSKPDVEEGAVRKVGFKGTGYIETMNYELDFQLYVKESDREYHVGFAGIVIPVVNAEHVKSLRNFAAKNIFQRRFSFKVVEVVEGKLMIVDLHPEDARSPLNRLLTEGWARLDKDAQRTLEPATTTGLRRLQELAMDARKKLWANLEARPRTAPAPNVVEDFEGRVIEVHSGDTLTVQRLNSDD